MGPGSDEVEQIRQEIDETRENLGEAVGALAYKADVKNRGREVVEDKKEMVMEKVDELKGKVTGDEGEPGIAGKAKDKLPDRDALKDKLPSGEGVKEKMPSGVGDAASTIGDKTPSKEDVKEKASGIAAKAGEHPAAVAGGAAVAGLAAGLALPETDLEREKLKPHAQEARQQAQSKAQETIEQVKSGAQDAAGSVADAVKQQGQQQGGKAGEMAEKAADKTQEKVGP